MSTGKKFRQPTKDEERVFKRIFRIPTTGKLDDDGTFLNNLIEFRWSFATSMDATTFFEYLYVEEINSFKKVLKELNKNIVDNKTSYHFVHSFGKNGKTTFIEKFIFDYDNEYELFPIDFAIDDRGSYKNFLFEKCIEWLLRLYKLKPIEFKEKSFILGEILNSIDHRVEGQRLRFISFKTGFDSWYDDYIDFIDCADKSNDNTFIDKKIKSLFIKLYSDNLINEAQIFSLLIILQLLLFSDEEKIKVIILDNLDDVFEGTIDMVGSDFIPHVDFIIGKLIEFMPDSVQYRDKLIDCREIEEKVQKLVYIFLFRTANYVSAVTNLQQNSNNSILGRTRALLRTPKYVLSSVKYSSAILLRKLDFYDFLCTHFGVIPSSRRDVIFNIINSFNKRNDKEYSYIFKLWNGNRDAFYRCIENIDFKNSNFEYIVTSKLVSAQTKRGLLMYFVTKHYLGNHILDAESNMAFSIDYFINSHKEDRKLKRCNLFRLFASIVINNQVDSKEIQGNEDIFKKGVSLKFILNEFDKIRSRNKPIYKGQDFINMFENIFHENIDSWSHFLTCVTNKISKDRKSIVKKYDFKDEIICWFEGNRNLPNFDRIKFFSNANCRYFLTYFKRHFEHFNATLNAGNFTTPISVNFSIFEAKSKDIELIDYSENGKRIRFKFETKYGINHHDNILETAKKTRESCLTTIEFFCRILSKRMDCKDYCNDSNLSLKSNFYFSDVILKHIRYLLNVRYELVTNRIPVIWKGRNLGSESILQFDEKSEDDKLQSINVYFVSYINYYISTFERCVSLLKKYRVFFSRNKVFDEKINEINKIKIKVRLMITSDFRNIYFYE